MSITKAGRVAGSGRPGIFLASAHGGLASVCLTAPDKSEGVKGQTQQILGRIDSLLEEVGSAKEHLVMAQVWLLSIQDADEFSEAWNAWIDADAAPALSVVEAPAAGRSSVVEIRAYAVQGSKTT